MNSSFNRNHPLSIIDEEHSCDPIMSINKAEKRNIGQIEKSQDFLMSDINKENDQYASNVLNK